MAAKAKSRTPSSYGIPVRVALVTFLCTLITFAVSLLFAILGTVILGALRHVHPDLRVAYRLIAIPVALVAGSIVMILSLIMEIRHYRQWKALSSIERSS